MLTLSYKVCLGCMALLTGVALAAAAPASAQDFPNTGVRLVVPAPAGGLTDTMGRIIAQPLSEMWGQSVVVDNRPGGNTGVGALVVSQSPADGYTLLVAPDSTFTANPAVFTKLGYDPKMFTPIVVLCRASPVLVVNASVKADNVKDLIALAKSQPGTMNYGSYGVGTYAHLGMEDFKQRTGTDIVHIPYRGAAAAANGLLAGDVSMLLINLSSIQAHEQTGKVRILATAADKRLVSRPDLSTIAEAGVPGFQVSAWFALWGPPAMPDELAKKIHADVTKVLDRPQVRDFFKINSLEHVDISPGQLGELIENDLKHWTELIKAFGPKME